ncbi:MAG TPA: MarR family transcriptional regulator [Actinomycetota bacterium]|nr:MarR family transcriptional regulator [Actinomycetota bacterium]
MSNETREDLIGQIGRAIQEYQNANDLLDDAAARLFGINRTDQRCLGVLNVRGPMTAGQLADATGMSPGAMTAVLDRMEWAGLVRRVRDAGDRRRVLVEITEQTLRAAEELYGPVREEGNRRLRDAPIEHLEVIRDFLVGAAELQRRHAQRILAMLPPPDVRESVRAAAREARAAAKVASAQWKATRAEVKAAAEEVKAAAKEVKAAAKAALKPSRRGRR